MTTSALRCAAVAAIGLGAILVSACGNGNSSDMSASEVVGKAKVGLTQEQLEDRLGEPIAELSSRTGPGVQLLEFEAKDKQIVSISLENGRVTDSKILGTPPSGNGTPPPPE